MRTTAAVWLFCLPLILRVQVTASSAPDSITNPEVRRSIPLDESCTDAPSKCKATLVCAGSCKKKRCVKPRTTGQSYFRRFEVCESNLLCAAGRCRPIPVGEGSSCNDKRIKCPVGLSCVGNHGNKKCFPKRKALQNCGRNAFQVCKRGLICAAGRCRPVPVGMGSSCNEPFVKCPKGLSCVGSSGNKKCFAKRRAGQDCGRNAFQVCKKGLICAAGRCRPVPTTG